MEKGARSKGMTRENGDLKLDEKQLDTVIVALSYTLQKERDRDKKLSMATNLAETCNELAALIRKQKGIQ